MGADILLHERHVLAAHVFAELVVWRVPRPVRGSGHDLKYRLALIVGGTCVLRYDNKAGKGDHRHFGAAEMPYRFRDADALLADFWADVETLRRANWRTGR